MRQTTPGTSLRMFVGEAETFDGKPLYEAVVLKARELGIAGATVLRGALGYGHTSHLHTGKILRLSDDLPVIVELVDTPEAIERFLDQIEPMLDRCAVTLTPVQRLHREVPASRPGD
ncbi:MULTISPECIES: DUF190 domain-containing protein [Luteimonas]|uniref:PII-like signaling protein n=1 Tax=Luteimonas terrae TaxID=1530191 RepID=A0ABU1XRG4_9GAMM|nr:MULTISPECIES: DUF190 domain-containing protein [Luteimonas]MDR6991979.1 PII-like signaling protein [Luteimonas sp. 3794]MDR7191355.1 PII-like signaling protein [Luteimonas terrae]